MPDTWEYPWYASWDLAFHCVAMSHIDPAFAKEQLLMMGYEWYQHANGQFPAYEWNFDDVNPPVQCWAAWRVYQIEFEKTGVRRHAVSKAHVSERDAQFQLLGQPQGQQRPRRVRRRLSGNGQHRLLRSRSSRWPTAASSSKATARAGWRSTAITMLTIAAELAASEPFYQNMAIKYFEHFLYIAHAMTNMDGAGIDLWDSEDEFFYDVILLPSGESIPLKIHSMVGLVPLFAVFVASPTARRRAWKTSRAGRSGFWRIGPTC